jgi:hypothetical protein
MIRNFAFHNQIKTPNTSIFRHGRRFEFPNPLHTRPCRLERVHTPTEHLFRKCSNGAFCTSKQHISQRRNNRVPSPPQNSGIDAENDYQLLRGCFYECECTKGKDKRDENYSRGARGAIHERGQQTNNKRMINHTGEMAISTALRPAQPLMDRPSRYEQGMPDCILMKLPRGTRHAHEGYTCTIEG